MFLRRHFANFPSWYIFEERRSRGGLGRKPSNSTFTWQILFMLSLRFRESWRKLTHISTLHFDVTIYPLRKMNFPSFPLIFCKTVLCVDDIRCTKRLPLLPPCFLYFFPISVSFCFYLINFLSDTSGFFLFLFFSKCMLDVEK